MSLNNNTSGLGMARRGMARLGVAGQGNIMKIPEKYFKVQIHKIKNANTPKPKSEGDLGK